MTTTRPPRASLLLALAGVTGAQLARVLGVSRQAVSLQLTGGTASTSPELLEAIEDLGGPELAGQVAQAIDAERARRRP